MDAEEGSGMLKIESARSFSTDERGHVISEREAARREHERREITLADVQARLARGERLQFFQAQSADDARYGATQPSASAPRPDAVLPPAESEQRTPVPGNIGSDVYQAFAAATGIRPIEHATVIEPDRSYASYALSCGFVPRTVRWTR